MRVLKGVGILLCLFVVVILGIVMRPRISSYVAPPGDAISSEKESTEILFVGDVMLGRYVRTLSEQHGLAYPFEKIKDVLQAVDFVVANLEGPIITNAPYTPLSGFQFSFVPEVAPLLAQNNVDLVSLGNNHGYDFGKEGYAETQHYLEASGIASVGNAVSVSTSTVLRKLGDRTYAFVSFNVTFPSFKEGEALELIRAMRMKGQLPIVLVHWGNEYELLSSLQQRTLAHAMVDAGASTIVGHHPHVVQEIELYNNVPIFYSLGNFIFDQYFSTDVQEGLAVKAIFADESVQFDIVPLRSIYSQPFVMQEAERGAFLQRLSARSSTLSKEIVSGAFVVHN
jgi:gamma-polyglutamate biosynthesis protein CapA